MKTLYEIFTGSRPPKPDPPPSLPAVLLGVAFACESCGWIVEGTDNMTCRKCGSAAIFHVESLLNQVKNRAVQRMKLQETMKAAKRKGGHNELAFLTAPDPPHHAA